MASINTSARESFKKNLNHYMNIRGIDQATIVTSLCITASTVSDWVNGKKYPRVDAMQKLADLLDVTMSDLTADHSELNNLPAAANRPSNAIRVPVLGSIPAGIPIEAIEDILDWEELPVSMSKGGTEYFALRVTGDSMYPNYLDGDIIILRRQETCNSGQDCAVMVNGDDATFKRVKISEKGISLQPLNAAYDPLYFTHEECASIPVRVVGVVVELRRKM